MLDSLCGGTLTCLPLTWGRGREGLGGSLDRRNLGRVTCELGTRGLLPPPLPSMWVPLPSCPKDTG